MKPYITDCWDTVARPVVIYSIVSEPEARIFCLALHNCIPEAGSCSTTQEIPHLQVPSPSPPQFQYLVHKSPLSDAVLNWYYVFTYCLLDSN